MPSFFPFTIEVKSVGTVARLSGTKPTSPQAIGVIFSQTLNYSVPPFPHMAVMIVIVLPQRVFVKIKSINHGKCLAQGVTHNKPKINIRH